MPLLEALLSIKEDSEYGPKYMLLAITEFAHCFNFLINAMRGKLKCPQRILGIYFGY